MVASVKCHSDQGQSTAIVARVIQSSSVMAIWPQPQPSLSRFSEDGFGSYWWLSVTTYIAIAIWRQFLPLSAHVLSWTMHYWLKISKDSWNFWIFARISFSVDLRTKIYLDKLVQNLMANKKVLLKFFTRRALKRVICKKLSKERWNFWIFARNSFSVDLATKKCSDKPVQNFVRNKKVLLTFVARRPPKRVICKKPPENFWKFSKSNNAYTKTWNRRLDCILHTVVTTVT